MSSLQPVTPLHVHTTKRYPGHYYRHWQQEVATPQ